MKMQIVLVSVSLLVLAVNSHPICNKVCSENITANVMFLDEWLDLSDDSKGIDQLRRRSRNSVASKLLSSMSPSVSQ